MPQKTFPELLESLLMMEYGKTQQEARELTTKYNNIVVQGIMSGLNFTNIRATAVAIDMAESKQGEKQ